MEKRLTFDAAKAEDRTLYETLWDAIILGGSVGDAKTKQELRKWARIQRIVKGVGEETTEFDARLRPPKPLTLMAGIHEIVLEVGDIEEIEKRIEKWKWPGVQEIQVADLLDFLSSAPKKE